MQQEQIYRCPIQYVVIANPGGVGRHAVLESLFELLVERLTVLVPGVEVDVAYAQRLLEDQHSFLPEA